MQKLGNLERWKYLDQDEAIKFPVARPVRLEVKTPQNTHWYIEEEGGGQAAKYLTTTSESDVIEFTPEKPVYLRASCDVRYSTVEGEQIHVPPTGNKAFVKIANRQQRNPEMERVAMMAAANATARMDAMHREERRQMRQEIAELRAQGVAVDEQTGEITDETAGSEGSSKAVPPKQKDAADTDTKVDSGKDGANTATGEGDGG
jgi:hypothetical protein